MPKSGTKSRKKSLVLPKHPCSELSPEVQQCQKDFKLSLHDACCLVQFFQPFRVPRKLSKDLVAFLVESKKRNSLTREEVCAIRFALAVRPQKKAQATIVELLRKKIA